MHLNGTCVCCGVSSAVNSGDGHCRPCSNGRCNHDEETTEYEPDFEAERDDREQAYHDLEGWT